MGFNKAFHSRLIQFRDSLPEDKRDHFMEMVRQSYQEGHNQSEANRRYWDNAPDWLSEDV